MQTKCKHCGKEYDTQRDTSKYCSNSCRTLANKLRRKNEQKLRERLNTFKIRQDQVDQQKLIDDALRTQRADKRRKAREEKASKAAPENHPDTEPMVQQEESVIIKPDIQMADEQKQPVKPEHKEISPRPFKDIWQEKVRMRKLAESNTKAKLKLRLDYRWWNRIQNS